MKVATASSEVEEWSMESWRESTTAVPLKDLRKSKIDLKNQKVTLKFCCYSICTIKGDLMESQSVVIIYQRSKTKKKKNCVLLTVMQFIIKFLPSEFVKLK